MWSWWLLSRGEILIEMKRSIVIVIFLVSFSVLNGQVRQDFDNVLFAKEFSKEVSVFKAKTFLIQNILNLDKNTTQFEVVALAAAGSGELTTLMYRCLSQKKEGLILGFYGNYWNKEGVIYQGYKFKNLPRDKAFLFLDKIETKIKENKNFLQSNSNSNNIVFRFDDMQILVWYENLSYNLRIYWGDFDATWEQTAYKRTKKRFKRNIEEINIIENSDNYYDNYR